MSSNRKGETGMSEQDELDRIAELERENQSLKEELANVRRWLSRADQDKADIVDKMNQQLAEMRRQLEGWKLVPIKPTEEMLKATEAAYETDCFGTKAAWPSDLWREMVAAAPQPPVADPLPPSKE